MKRLIALLAALLLPLAALADTAREAASPTVNLLSISPDGKTTLYAVGNVYLLSDGNVHRPVTFSRERSVEDRYGKFERFEKIGRQYLAGMFVWSPDG